MTGGSTSGPHSGCSHDCPVRVEFETRSLFLSLACNGRVITWKQALNRGLRVRVAQVGSGSGCRGLEGRRMEGGSRVGVSRRAPEKPGQSEADPRLQGRGAEDAPASLRVTWPHSRA